MRVPPSLTLVGDGVENPHNARALLDAAAFFGVGSVFRDRAGLAERWRDQFPDADGLSLIELPSLINEHDQVIILDNVPGAVDIYGFRAPSETRTAIVAGNERRGVARDVHAVAQATVRIPMLGRRINTLNVAAASAVALYYLARGGSGPMAASTRPYQRRPEVLFLGPRDHAEAGSSIRSAAAFGWERVFIDDRHHVWFHTDRVTRSEGRAAARRGRNAIRVVPVMAEQQLAFDHVCVIRASGGGAPLGKARLAGGSRHLIVVPDESDNMRDEDWERFGRTVSFHHIETPTVPRPSTCRYRLLASIALAEAARQIGRPKPETPRPRRAPVYDYALEMLALEVGVEAAIDELQDY